jgi:hypothetical protein
MSAAMGPGGHPGYRDLGHQDDGGGQPRLGLVWDPEEGWEDKALCLAGRFYYALLTDLCSRLWSADLAHLQLHPVSLVQDPQRSQPRECSSPGAVERAGGQRLEGYLSGRIQSSVSREVARSHVFDRPKGTSQPWPCDRGQVDLTTTLPSTTAVLVPSSIPAPTGSGQVEASRAATAS